MRRIGTVVTLVLLAVVVGCGGGGSPEGSTGSRFAGSFTPDAQNPGANTVYMTGTPGSDPSLVTIHVFVSNTNDVYGASFDLTYDPSMAQFKNFAKGQLLEFGGQSVSYQINASTPGRIVVGVARTSGGVGVTVPDSQALIHLTLQVTDTGSSSVEFMNPALLNSQDPPQSKSGISFFGGTLTGV